jgi:branched-chain amino acid transport system substrate-binding protein
LVIGVKAPQIQFMGETPMKFGNVAKTIAVCAGLVGGFAAGVDAQTLKIGVISPLTGGAAPWGNAMAESARMAAADVNAKGGLEVGGKKYQVEVIAYDDQYKAADAVAAYNRLTTQDGVKIMGVLASPSTLALRDTVENDKNIMLTSSGIEKSVDPNSKYMLRMLSILREFVPATIRWVRDNQKERRVAILNPNDESGWYSTDISKTNYLKYGFDVVSSELFERATKDFQPLLTRVLAAKPEIIELASVPPATAGLIVRQARELGFKGIVVKDAGAAVKETIETAGKEGAEGTISLHYGDPTSPGYKRLAEVYRKKFNQDPDDLIVVYYDAFNAVLQAVHQSGSVDDTKKISDAFFNKTFPIQSILGGELALGGANGLPGDPNQIITWSYISKIHDGQMVIVGKVR